MFIALTIATIALAMAATMSAAMKITKNEMVLEGIHRTVGVPLPYIPVLAGLELAGAAGIVIGLWVKPLGIAAAVGLVLYFVGAILGHVRVNDTKGMANPVVPLLLSIAVLVLRLAVS